jgi:hypothetical protein
LLAINKQRVYLAPQILVSRALFIQKFAPLGLIVFQRGMI